MNVGIEADALLAREPGLAARARAVRMVVFDVDGVLTDGRLFLAEDGTEIKVFHSRDGQGLVMLLATGVRVGVISGRSSPVVTERMRALGIHCVHQGCGDKLPVLEGLLAEFGLGFDQVAYVGDDLPDLPPLLRVGLAVAVADAHPLVRRHAHWTTTLPGGKGAAREICDLVMEAQQTLGGLYARYLG